MGFFKIGIYSEIFVVVTTFSGTPPSEYGTCKTIKVELTWDMSDDQCQILALAFR